MHAAASITEMSEVLGLFLVLFKPVAHRIGLHCDFEDLNALSIPKLN